MKNNKLPFPTKKNLIDWFGDRAELILPSWIKKWAVKDNYLYIKWSDSAPYHLKPEHPFDSNCVNWKSLYFEFEDDCFWNHIFPSSTLKDTKL